MFIPIMMFYGVELPYVAPDLFLCDGPICCVATTLVGLDDDLVASRHCVHKSVTVRGRKAERGQVESFADLKLSA